MSSVSVKTFSSCTNADVADAVMSLATPLFAACGDDETMKRHLVSLAVTGWNLSLFEAEGKNGYIQKVGERLPEGLPEDRKQIFMQFVIQIIATKQAKYPSMMKGIKSWALDFENGTPSLRVEALPVKPL